MDSAVEAVGRVTRGQTWDACDEACDEETQMLVFMDIPFEFSWAIDRELAATVDLALKQ